MMPPFSFAPSHLSTTLWTECAITKGTSSKPWLTCLLAAIYQRGSKKDFLLLLELAASCLLETFVVLVQVEVLS